MERSFKIQRLHSPLFDVIVFDENGEELGRTAFHSIHSAIQFVFTCREIDIEQSEVCQYCEGEGEVPCMDYVYAGEPHMAMVGTQKCICREDDGDDRSDED